MATMRITHHSKGARELLVAPGVWADLRARAERIAAAAGEGFEVKENRGGQRAHVSVVASTDDAKRAEAVDRVLTRAIDAGR